MSKETEVNQPSHYDLGWGWVECIEVQEKLGFDKNSRLASAFEYLWRCESKGSKIADLKKVLYYVSRELLLIHKAEKELLTTGSLEDLLEVPIRLFIRVNRSLKVDPEKLVDSVMNCICNELADQDGSGSE